MDEELPCVVVSSAQAGKWTVHIEPWGTEFVFDQDDKLYVYSDSFRKSEVEIAYFSTGVVLYFSGLTEPKMFNQRDEELRL